MDKIGAVQQLCEAGTGEKMENAVAHTSGPSEWLQKEIRQEMDLWRSENQGEYYWKDPLVGIASANDPDLLKLKDVVDPDHALPRDLLPEARSVVVFFLPFIEKLSKENARNGHFAAKSWGEAYVATNRLIHAINEHLSNCMKQNGHQTAVTPATHNFDQEKLISLWSHKHLAYIAGLGTFGIHHQLITYSGCSGRLGSLVTSMPLLPTPRLNTELCLQKNGRRCLACVSKCAYGALSADRFDRHACYAQLLRNDTYYADLPLVDVCGKCASFVPCSHMAPTLKRI